MKFTRLTYKVAIRRAKKLEYLLFIEHTRAFRGPHAWLKQKRHTDALKARRHRRYSNACR